MRTTRILTFAVFLFLAFQPSLLAQRPGSSQESVVLGLPIASSDSVVDNQGNLFLFRTSYTTTKAGTSIGTHVTVVTPGKIALAPRDYPGTFSQFVVGAHALYATTPSTASVLLGSSIAPSLAALYLAGGALPAVPQSLSLDGYYEIKVWPGLSFDTIYLVQSPVFYPYRSTSASGFVRVVTFDGKNFNDLGKVQLP